MKKILILFILIALIIPLSTKAGILDWISNLYHRTPQIGAAIFRVEQGGTGINTIKQGDLLVGTSSNKLYLLATNTEGYVLTISSGIPAWTAGGAAGVSSLNTLTGVLTLWGTSPLTVTPSSTVGLLLTYTESDPKWTASSTSYLTITSAGQIYLATGTAASTYLATGTAASTYVPYTGATGAVNLGSQTITTSGIGTFGSVAIPTLFTNTTEPTGFVDKTATLSFATSTRIFTITGNHDIYINGVKTTKATASTTIADTTGMHWVYYDSVGTLSESTTQPGFDVPLIATVYWNTTIDKALLGEERHGIIMDGATHHLLHNTVGTRYESGLTGTFSNATTSITAGVIDDEDLEHSIGIQTTVDIIYKNGAADFEWITGQTKYYIEDTGSDILYNNGNATGTVGANNYVCYWIFATNATSSPIVSLMGQRTDTTITDARANCKYESLTLGTLPYQEMKLLYRVILRNDATPYEEAQDLRSISNLPAGTFLATQHNALTGLDFDNSGHTGFQAYDANNATTGSSITGFAGYLASSTWAKVANNLSDLANTSTARTNLGLGDAALQASSTWIKYTDATSTNLNTLYNWYLATSSNLNLAYSYGSYFNSSSSNYNLAYTYGSAYNSTSSNINAVYNWYSASSTLHNSMVTWLNSSTTNLNAAYTYGSYFNSSSSNYNLAYTYGSYFNSSSSNYNAAYGILNASSSNYNKAYTWATSSETWHTLFTASTTNWDTAYGKVNASSSKWDLGYTYGLITNNSSTNWNAAYGSYGVNTRLGQIGDLASTSGNLIVGSTTVWTTLGVGTTGKVLTASSTSPGGISWENAPATSLTGGQTGYSTYWKGATTVGTTTYQANFTIYADSSWNSEAVPIWQSTKDMAITIVQVEAATMGNATSQIGFNIEERTNVNTAGTDIFATEQLAATSSTSFTSFSNAGIAEKAYLVFTTAASGVETSTVDAIIGTIYYTK